ncbi:HAD domain-containing protein [Streptomyces sp. N35]|uniref:HAD domain-containing protein n=1 Tax=Streptomyces sp. N35 TaxID=2795730 RepID=UPI0018F6995E|nr:HAD domain-containing protein [Streptomyces sp. N35]
MLPLLFLDVDGPLIPFGGGGHPTYEPLPAASDANPLLARINPALGPRLLALPCEPVWATTWGEDANEEVAPRLGLPDLPVLGWTEGGRPEGLLHWKTRPIVAWAGGRPFVWIDDEIGERDRSWVVENHPGPSLLLRVAPELGLTEADLAAVGRWLAKLDG